MDWLKLKTWQCGRQRMLRGASMTWQGARSGVVPLKTQWGKEANPSTVTGHSKNMCSPMRCPSCWIDSETKWCPCRTPLLFSVPASRFCILYRCLLSCSLWDQIGVSSLLINVHGGKENSRSLSLAWGPNLEPEWPGAMFLSLQQLCHLPHSMCPWVPSLTVPSCYMFHSTLSSKKAWRPVMLRSRFQTPVFCLHSRTWSQVPMDTFT